MALTNNRNVDHFIDQELREYPVQPNTHVYKGSLVGFSPQGLARPLEPGDLFAGIAYEEVNNPSTGNRVRTYTIGDFTLPLPGTDQTSISRPVFANDDRNIATSGETWVGRIRDMASAGNPIVRIETLNDPTRTITVEINDLATGADWPARAVHQFKQAAWITDARVVNHESNAGGINDANPSVIIVEAGAGNIVNHSFNSSSTFPPPNNTASLLPLANPLVTAGAVLTVAIFNATGANLPPFAIEIEYA